MSKPAKPAFDKLQEKMREAAVAAVAVDAGTPWKPKNLYVTDFSSGCSRYLALKLLVIRGIIDPPPYIPSIYGLMGTWAHEKVLGSMVKKKILKRKEVRFSREWHGVTITGKFDGEITKLHIFEYKTLNGKQFEKVKSLKPGENSSILDSYHRQTQIYMAFTGATHCTVAIHNSDDIHDQSEIVFLHYELDSYTIAALQNQLEEAINAANKIKDIPGDLGLLPNRVSLSCPYCPFSEKYCSVFLPASVAQGGGDLISILPRAAEVCRISRAIDDKIKALGVYKDKLRAGLVSALEKLGKKSAQAGGYTVIISERERKYYPTELIEPLAEKAGIVKKVTPYTVLSIRENKSKKQVEQEALSE